MQCVCLKCGYKWLSRLENNQIPKQCPNCKRLDWMIPPKEKLTCLKCGYKWPTKKREGVPIQCPSCESKEWNIPPKKKVKPWSKT